MKIAVIGAGISGLAAARILMQCGHTVTVFERSPSLGGVWAAAYPEVTLQNIAEHYRVSDFPWPFPPELHPTGGQILRYLEALVAHYRLPVRLGHEVMSLVEAPEVPGWQVEVRGPAETTRERFDFVLVAVGQYTGPPQAMALHDRERFSGSVITEREVRELAIFKNKRVAVVGFGKSAVDMATLAAEQGAQVHHIFRSPRWLLPKHLFGIHMSKILFSRISTALIPAWVQPSAAERYLHTRLPQVVNGFWSLIESVLRFQTRGHARGADAAARRRLALLEPESPLPYEMRSASALAPDRYYPLVVAGRIEPHRGEVLGFEPDAVTLRDGRRISCELVVLSTGSESPRFPFLPPAYRALIEGESDGMQLYRHLLHPRIPRLAFAGFNHGFMHVPSVEIATLWLCAFLRGDLVLPAVSEMERCIEEIRRWKRTNILFEPSRGCATSTRFHQYADILLLDLGLRPYRKSNPISELVAGYAAADYAGLSDEYERVRQNLALPRRPLPLST